MNTIPLFPLSRALFPGGILHLRIFEVRYLDMIQQCLDNHTEFGVVALTSGSEVRLPMAQETFIDAGTLARIDEAQTVMPGLMQIQCSGTHRFKLSNPSQQKNGLWKAQITLLRAEQSVAIPDDLQACADALGSVIADLQRDGVPPQAMPISPPFMLNDAAWVSNRWAELLPLPPTQKALLLTEDDPTQRLDLLREVLL
ncbi:MAG: LON peptidase substrate-binding domain-containing protein, partial [Pusillimonas sp.]|nr:LON peptidase substrate-binding domain-containing protein [Pusillimonas sp.]